MGGWRRRDSRSERLYPLVLSCSDFKTVISLKVHKSIYRRMFLRLEIDFIPVYFEEYYGTGMEEKRIEKGMYFFGAWV